MFLHIGGDAVILLENIVSILDFNTIRKSKDTRSYLRIAEEEGFTIEISKNEPKSCIIAEEVRMERKSKTRSVQTVVYYSPISSTTLQKRVRSLKTL